MRKDDRLLDAFEDLAPRYESTVSSELQKFWGWNYSSFVDALIESTPVYAEDTVLDIATGTGMIPRRYLENGKVPFRFYGLDITWDMLKNARKKITAGKHTDRIELTCADAQVMPFQKEAFSVILCGLATHHMDVPRLLSEMARVLQSGGRLTIADVAGSSLWRFPGIKTLLKIATFIYFSVTENNSRANIESAALTNIRTPDEWNASLMRHGFSSIQIIQLPKKFSWIPSPLLITARKINKKG